ncbi:MAG: hypothetical protein NVSMB20_12550 [Bradyrhizobium sp.]
MQPIAGSRSTPTQMLPIMPSVGTKAERQGKPNGPPPAKKPRTRTEAVRAAMARITRRKSLQKQRDAQKD